MIDYSMPFYGKLKMKERKWIAEKSYLDIFNITFASMFKYYSESEDVRQLVNDMNFRLEYLLRMFGKVGVCRDKNGKLVFGKAHFIGDLDYLGRGKGLSITTENGEVYNCTIGVDCVVIYNNILAHSELNIMRFCHQLTEVDISQVDLLVNARAHSIILAPDDKTAKIIKDVIEKSNDGNPRTIAYDGAIENGLLTGNNDPIKVLSVTDPQTAELFQYYSHYHLDLMGWLYGMYGLSTFNTGKMAQTNDLEVSGSLASSMAIPIANFEIRQTCLEELERVFGVSISVEFGVCWKNQLAMLQGIKHEDFNVIAEDDNTLDGDTNPDESTGETVKDKANNENLENA